MDVTRVGTLVGEDKFGNKYYEDNSYFMPRNRWVEYPEKASLASSHSRMTRHTPEPCPKNEEYAVMPTEENLSIFQDKKYVPYSTTRTKIQAWQPGQKKQE
ncbi:NADH dehydrogenase [ubiquinone] 1 alpha subcomplex subunit 12 family protein [Cooperia oncophora]